MCVWERESVCMCVTEAAVLKWREERRAMVRRQESSSGPTGSSLSDGDKTEGR